MLVIVRQTLPAIIMAWAKEAVKIQTRVESVRKLFLNLIFFMVMVGTTATAQASQSWEIRRISGMAWLLDTKSEEEIVLTKNAQLKPGHTLKTGDRSRVLLARGKERIQVSSNTIMSIPKDEGNDPDNTLIKLKTGKLDLIVKKMPNKHFTVDTPFIAAVVKGTRFTVSSTATRSLVRVFEGMVGVNSNISEESADIRPGQAASMTSSSQVPTRLLLLDNPPQAKLFADYPEIFTELKIPNPNPQTRSALKEDNGQSDIISGTLGFILSAIGAVFFGLGNVISAVFTPILMPAIDLIDMIYESVLPNSMPVLLLLAAIIGMAIALIIAYSMKKKRY